MKVTRKFSEDGGWNMSVEERVKELGIILPVPAKHVVWDRCANPVSLPAWL